MLWTTRTYVVENMFINVVHNIYMFSTTYDMLWSTFAVFHYVPHNIHPQYIMFSTTYTHNICSFICCGYMLWTTTPICCGVHMLWSATSFTDAETSRNPKRKFKLTHLFVDYGSVRSGVTKPRPKLGIHLMDKSFMV